MFAKAYTKKHYSIYIVCSYFSILVTCTKMLRKWLFSACGKELLIKKRCQCQRSGPCETAGCPQLCVGDVNNTKAVCLCDEWYSQSPNSDSISCIPLQLAGPQLMVALKSNTSQLLGGWNASIIGMLGNDMTSSMTVVSQDFYTDIDFLYSKQVVFKTFANFISYDTFNFYQIGAGLGTGSISSMYVFLALIKQQMTLFQNVNSSASLLNVAKYEFYY